MLIYSFITDYQAFSLRCKDNTTRDKNETKVGKQSANLGKNNEPIQNRFSFLIDCKSVTLHHLTILSFPMVRPAWDNWRLTWIICFNPRTHVGCDHSILHSAAARRSFNPRTHVGCDMKAVIGTWNVLQFQSTHPRRVRPLILLGSQTDYVSIHAPT